MGDFVMGMITATVLLFGVAIISDSSRDDSDPPTGSRSRLDPTADHLTGCQYLLGGGGITPRLSGAGVHVGCRP